MRFGCIWTHEEACGYVVKILCNPLCLRGGAVMLCPWFRASRRPLIHFTALFADPALVEVQKSVGTAKILVFQKSIGVVNQQISLWLCLLKKLFRFVSHLWLFNLSQRVFPLFVAVFYHCSKTTITSWKRFQMVDSPFKNIILSRLSELWNSVLLTQSQNEFQMKTCIASSVTKQLKFAAFFFSSNFLHIKQLFC